MTQDAKRRMRRTVPELPALIHSDYSMQSAAMRSTERETERVAVLRYHASIAAHSIREIRAGLADTQPMQAIDE